MRVIYHLMHGCRCRRCRCSNEKACDKRARARETRQLPRQCKFRGSASNQRVIDCLSFDDGMVRIDSARMA